MNNQFETIKHLKDQITQLKRDKEQLRLFLHEIIEVFYKSMNKTSKASSPEPFDLEKLFKILSSLNSNQQANNNQANECSFNSFKDFFSHTYTKKEATHE